MLTERTLEWIGAGCAIVGAIGIALNLGGDVIAASYALFLVSSTLYVRIAWRIGDTPLLTMQAEKKEG